MIAKKYFDWSDENKHTLTTLFPVTDNAILAVKFGITERAVRSQAKRMNLNKAHRYWSQYDEQWLLANYNATGVGMAELLAKFPNKTKWAIINKYRSLSGKRIDNAYKK